MIGADAPACAASSGKSSHRPWKRAAAGRALPFGALGAVALLAACQVVDGVDEARLGARDSAAASLVRLLPVLDAGAVRPELRRSDAEIEATVVHAGTGSLGIADGPLCEIPLPAYQVIYSGFCLVAFRL